jgi:hypothetical protein
MSSKTNFKFECLKAPKMIKTLVASIVCFMLLSPTFMDGQSKDASGYIVLTTGDTIYGIVDYLDERGTNLKFYKKIRLTDRNGKRKKYKTKIITAFRSSNQIYRAFWLDNSSDKIIFINPIYTSDFEKGEREFLKVITNGELSHYRLEWWEQGESLLMTMELLKKANDSFFIRADQGLLGLKRKTLTTYFKDCPELSEQIKSKTIKTVWEVVACYNIECSFLN